VEAQAFTVATMSAGVVALHDAAGLDRGSDDKYHLRPHRYLSAHPDI